MDELGDIEARREATAANLRRAFGAPAGGEPQAFGELLARLAAKGVARPGPHPGALPAARLPSGAAWSHPLADT